MNDEGNDIMEDESKDIMDDDSRNEPGDEGRGASPRVWRAVVFLLYFAFFMLGAGQLGRATLTTDDSGTACATTTVAADCHRTGDGA